MPNVSHLDDTALFRKNRALAEAAQAILEGAEYQGRDNLTPGEERQFQGIMRQMDVLNAQLTPEGRAKLGPDMTEEQRRLARGASRKGLSTMPSTGSLTRPNPQDGGNIGMSDRELSQYSIVRAIRSMASGDWRDGSLELAASDAVAQRLGKPARGVYVPSDVIEQRDLLKGTAGMGGYTVATDLLGASFIDILRNKSCVMSAGATVLDGLVGDITIPRQSAGATAYWVAENVAPTESQQTFEQVALSPRSVAGYTDISRKLLLQSSLDVEMLVRNDLAATLATEIDRVALHGSGSGSQPTGIDHTTGIGAPVDYSSVGLVPTLAHIVALESAVAVANADIGKLAYITNAKVRGKLKVTPIVATYSADMVWGKGATPLNDYPAYVTNQVSSTLTAGSSSGICSAVFFGNWADLLMGHWGALDLLIDPFTGGTSGAVRVIAFQDVDIGVRHPLSFAALLGVLTT